MNKGDSFILSEEKLLTLTLVKWYLLALNQLSILTGAGLPSSGVTMLLHDLEKSPPPQEI